MLQLLNQSSQLQVTDTALCNSTSRSPTELRVHELNLHIKRAHLKFLVSSQSKQANIHTHVYNEVTLGELGSTVKGIKKGVGIFLRVDIFWVITV